VLAVEVNEEAWPVRLDFRAGARSAEEADQAAGRFRFGARAIATGPDAERDAGPLFEILKRRHEDPHHKAGHPRHWNLPADHGQQVVLLEFAAADAGHAGIARHDK